MNEAGGEYSIFFDKVTRPIKGMKEYLGEAAELIHSFKGKSDSEIDKLKLRDG